CDVSSVVPTDYLEYILVILRRVLTQLSEEASHVCPHNSPAILSHQRKRKPTLPDSHTHQRAIKRCRESDHHRQPPHNHHHDHHHHHHHHDHQSSLEETIRRHANTFISLCSTGRWLFRLSVAHAPFLPRHCITERDEL